MNKYAAGSCLIKVGDTHLICTATLESSVPAFLRNQKTGWLHAEYNMLPMATESRTKREAVSGKQGGRTLEIQRLIGRSLRSVINLDLIGERQFIIDCDVIQADGGTRVAAITGGYVALALACKKLTKQRILSKNPIIGSVAAISAGILNRFGQATQYAVDLNYEEDSKAMVDANFVMKNDENFIEVQATGENSSFSTEELIYILNLIKPILNDILTLQKEIIES